MFDLNAVQHAINEFGFDGWLLFDFRGSNVLALRILGIDPEHIGSRRFLYYVPKSGSPVKLVHRIESAVLDHLAGEKIVYLRWQEFEAGIEKMIDGGRRIAMEYSPRNGNPYVSRVDAGIVEIVSQTGATVVSSGDLIQFFEARWTPEQWQLHRQADRLNQQAFDSAWRFIVEHVRSSGEVRETEVQSFMMDFFHSNNMTTYHPPIIGANENSGDPHYSPQAGRDKAIRLNDFVLIDSWAKMKAPQSVYSDLTKVGFVGEAVPKKHAEIFQIVSAARDAGIKCVKDAFAGSEHIFGWQVDEATRKVIEDAGYGEYFVHRTGHNIGQEVHGNGAHIDYLETREDRRILPETCFSIEPGIYLPEFGVRSEIDVFIEADGKVNVTGGLQQEVIPLLKDY